MSNDIKIAKGLPDLDIQIKEQRTIDDFHGDQGMYDQYLAVKQMAQRMDKQRRLAEHAKQDNGDK